MFRNMQTDTRDLRAQQQATKTECILPFNPQAALPDSLYSCRRVQLENSGLGEVNNLLKAPELAKKTDSQPIFC